MNNHFTALLVFALSFSAHTAHAGVSNTSASFTDVITRDLFDVVPFPDNRDYMHGVKCRNGIVYASEGSSGQTGWSLATGVCHRGKDKNSAFWVLHIPQMTNYPEENGKGNIYTMVTHDGGYARPGTVGLDCIFTRDGWSCKKIIETKGLIFILTKDKNYQLDDSAYDYSRVMGAKRSKLKPYVTD